MNIEEEFKEFLTEWVKKSYGESEADNPSWSIKALAHDLADKFWKMKEEYDWINITDDVKYVAEQNGIKLTERQAQAVADKYRFSDTYCALDEEALLYYIENYKGDE